MRFPLLFLALMSFSIPSAISQQTTTTSAASRAAAAADSNTLRTHLDFLADDLLEGRRPGTRGAELAARYIAAQFQRVGLEPAGDSGTFYQRVPIITLTPTPSLKVMTPSPAELAYRNDYVLWSMRNDPVTSAKAEAVFVGYGIVASEYDWNDYDGIE